MSMNFFNHTIRFFRMIKKVHSKVERFHQIKNIGKASLSSFYKIFNLMKSIFNVLEENGLVNPTTGEVLPIRYLPGYPLQYRFDASRGIFNIGGDRPITKKGASITFTPICYRIFRDDILGYGRKRWVEFFFINDKQVICNLLLHGYSVENLMKTIQAMYYDNVRLDEVALTIKPTERNNKTSGNKYFIAEFTYQSLPKEQRKNPMLESLQQVPIWREDTLTGDAHTELAFNYNPPIKMVERERKKAA